MLTIVGDGEYSNLSSINWVETWNRSPERKQLLDELDTMTATSMTEVPTAQEREEFAMPLKIQLYHVIKRDFQQYYRQPGYIIAKFALGIVCGLFIGFSFWMSDSSLQGFHNTLFSLFLLCTIFSTMVNQYDSLLLGSVVGYSL